MEQEANLNRINVSQAAQELKDFITQHEKKDALCNEEILKNYNPWAEKMCECLFKRFACLSCLSGGYDPIDMDSNGPANEDL